jgi:uncharacterized protein (UPF0297 family)
MAGYNSKFDTSSIGEKEKTITFSIRDEKDLEIKRVLGTVYSALSEKGYNPINQIVGYILSEDPTYITNHKNARSLICKVDRDDILNCLVRNFLDL